MAVTVYRYDDSSAPGLSASPGSLIALLDACLVNGYGAKSAAGWTKPYNGTNLAAYKQGAGSNNMYLRVDNSVSAVSYSRVLGYETMSDVNTGVNGFPTNVQVPGGLCLHVSSTTDATARPWVLIADSKRFYIWVGYNLTTVQGPSGSTTYQQTHFFGDLVSYKPGDTYHCAIVANHATNPLTGYFSGTVSNITTGQTGHFIARPASQVGGSLNIGKFSDVTAGYGSSVMGATDRTAYPDPVTGGIRLGRVFCNNGATPSTRGHFPGWWAPFNALPGNPGDTFSGAGDLTGRTFILLDSGSSYNRARIALETSNTWD